MISRYQPPWDIKNLFVQIEENNLRKKILNIYEAPISC